MTPLERAARAVGDTVSACPSTENYIAVARAVLQAIREPSVDMNYKGCLNHPPANTAGIWRAMIDAALEEG